MEFFALGLRLLQRFYSQQEGTILIDKESDIFPIKQRGTKQGEQLSSLLFKTVMQVVAGKTKRYKVERQNRRLFEIC